MKTKLGLLALLSPLFLCGPLCADEMYKCGATYSNKPCDDGSSPIQNLPRLGRVSGGKSGVAEAVEDVEDKEEEGKIVEEKETPTCRPDPNGAELRISGMKATVQNGELSFTGTVQNGSQMNVNGGISVEIKRAGSREISIKDVAASLPAGGRTSFSYLAPRGTPLQSSYEFRLLYEPARKCETYRMPGVAAELQDEATGGTTKVESQKTKYNQSLKDLEALEGEIKARRAKKRVRSSSDQEEVASLVRFQSRLSAICSVVNTKDGDALDRKCQKVKELLDNYWS